MVCQKQGLIAALLLSVCASAVAADPLHRIDLPDWVELRDVPAPLGASGSFVVGGVETLLSDAQIRIEDMGQTWFHRDVLAVSDRTGLEDAGSVQIELEPSLQYVQLHHINIHRDGAILDRSDLSFDELRREARLSQGVFDGRILLHGNIADIRVGDIVDIAYSITRQPPVFPDEISLRLWGDVMYPQHLRADRVLVPADRPIALRHSDENTPNVTRNGAYISYEWTQEQAQPSDYDRRYASWAQLDDLIQISSFSSWADVAQGLSDAYSPATLPPEVLTLAQQIMRAHPDPDRRVTEAFRLVQDRIRYVSLSIGEGGFIPRRPVTVWEQGFGDCKDKALLLVSILDHMGIGADVVLVDTDYGPALPDALPMPFAFDHAIVRVHGRAGAYFIDPTDMLQGGVGPDIWVADYRYGLPLTKDSAALVPITRPELTAPTQEVHDRYTLHTPWADDAAELTSRTTYRGPMADQMRRQFQGGGLSEREESYLEWYQDQSAGAWFAEPIRIEDDLDANVLTVVEHVIFPQDGFHEANRWKRFWLNPHATKARLRNPGDDPVTRPIPLNPTLWRHHVVELHGLPSNMPPIPSKELRTELGSWSRHIEGPAENRLVATYDLRILGDAITPDTAEDWRVFIEDVRNDRDWSVDLYTLHLREIGANVQIAGLSAKWVSIGVAAFIFLFLMLPSYRKGRAEAFVKKP